MTSTVCTDARTTDELIAGDRADIERSLLEHLSEDCDAVRLPMQRLVCAGGKRLRPLLVLACARLGSSTANDSPLRLAVAFELLHSATLVHDDYVDDAAKRRGHATVAGAEGAVAAVAVGDYYFAKATRLTASLGCPELSRILADAVERICLSQIEEVRLRRGYPGKRQTYIDVVRGKTAALFEAACRGGAEIVAAGQDAVERAGRFGDLLGVAFQMCDDVLDYREGTGKPLAQDIRQRVVALPLVYAAEHPELGERTRALLASPPTDAVVREVCELVGASGALDRVWADARAFAEQARCEADGFAVPETREALRALLALAIGPEG